MEDDNESIQFEFSPISPPFSLINKICKPDKCNSNASPTACRTTTNEQPSSSFRAITSHDYVSPKACRTTTNEQPSSSFRAINSHSNASTPVLNSNVHIDSQIDSLHVRLLRQENQLKELSNVLNYPNTFVSNHSIF